MACGIRASGEGSGPADTPTNGGSRGAAPPGNLGIRTGQRPTIHRLHRCRGPIGPRASVTPARPHHAPAHLSRGGNGRRCGGRPPPFLRRGSRECGSPQRHQPQRGSLPGREEFVGAPAAACPPRGGFGLCLHHSYIYSPAPVGHPGVPHAPLGPGRSPEGRPTMGVDRRGATSRTQWATHITPLVVPQAVLQGARLACHEQVEYSSSPSPKTGLVWTRGINSTHTHSQ